MNRSTIKIMAKYTGLLRLKNLWYRLRDRILSDCFECSVGDILLCRAVPLNNQLLLTSRLMDVEAYISGEDKSFPYQNTISRKAYGDRHREQDGNRSFSALIESYLKDGYHSDSYVTCDKEMRLLDGNHRIGLHIHEKIERINVRRLRRNVPFSNGCDWYLGVGLPTDFMESIFHRFDEVQQWLIATGNTFCIWLKGAGADETLLKDARHLCNVLNTNILGGGITAILGNESPILCDRW